MRFFNSPGIRGIADSAVCFKLCNNALIWDRSLFVLVVEATCKKDNLPRGFSLWELKFTKLDSCLLLLMSAFLPTVALEYVFWSKIYIGLKRYLVTRGSSY